MSIAESPIFGHMSKSMANFTVYTLNGKNIVRSKAFMPKDPKSKKQLAVRSRIAALGKQYRMLSPILVLGFPENSDNKTPQNMFVATDPYKDNSIEEYRTKRPVIVHYGFGESTSAYSDKIKKGIKVIWITYNNTQFGFIDIENGKYYWCGQD